jgi:hypothetical protein
MKILKLAAALFLVLASTNAMAAEGINSTGVDLPVGAGGMTLFKANSNGRINFYPPATTAVPVSAWIDTTSGLASFGTQLAGGGITIGGNQLSSNSGDLYLNNSTGGNSSVVIGGTNQTTDLHVVQGSVYATTLSTNSGDLYLNKITNGNSSVVIGDTNKTTNLHVVQGSVNATTLVSGVSLTIGSFTLNATQLGKVVDMVTAFDSCAVGQTIVKSASGYICGSPSAGITEIRAPEQGGDWRNMGSCPSGYYDIYYTYRPGNHNNTEFKLCGKN